MKDEHKSTIRVTGASPEEIATLRSALAFYSGACQDRRCSAAQDKQGRHWKPGAVAEFTRRINQISAIYRTLFPTVAEEFPELTTPPP